MLLCLFGGEAFVYAVIDTLSFFFILSDKKEQRIRPIIKTPPYPLKGQSGGLQIQNCRILSRPFFLQDR